MGCFLNRNFKLPTDLPPASWHLICVFVVKGAVLYKKIKFEFSAVLHLLST